MGIGRKGQIGTRFIIYLIGLLIMCLGIDLLIVADLGAIPWDVLHVGLYYQFGLTIGTWNIIVGIIILTISAFISKELPQIGAFLNMVLCGIFIDMYLMLPFMETPGTFAGKIIMFLLGMVIYGYGMGIYISSRLGTGPRDSLMMAISEKTKWKVGNVRAVIEILVLIIGWLLEGPIYWGTVFYGLTIGPIAGFVLPKCQQFTDQLLDKTKNHMLKQSKTETNRGVDL